MARGSVKIEKGRKTVHCQHFTGCVLHGKVKGKREIDSRKLGTRGTPGWGGKVSLRSKLHHE